MNKTVRRTYRERLLELAQYQHGFVTTADARRLNIPPIELRKLASRGKLENVRRGVYQFSQLSGSANESYLSALLSVGEDACLIGDSVLAFHGLAQVNPRKIRVGTSKRIRHHVPDQISLTSYAAPESEIEIRDGVRTTRVARAIIDAKEVVMRSRLLSALDEAIELGLITTFEATAVRSILAK